jgi:hypothetical protein
VSRKLRACLLVLGFLATASATEAGEAFLKGGFDLRPNDASGYDFLDGWLISFGYGFPVAPIVWLEAEVQSSYQSYMLGGHVQLHAVPVNGFFNVRLGPPGRGLYGGSGLGYLSEIAWGTVDLFPATVEFSEYHKDLGFHVFAGASLGGGIFVEYLGQTSLDVGQIYGSGWRHFALGGVRW